MDINSFFRKLAYIALALAVLSVLKGIYHREYRPLEEAIFVGIFTLIGWGVTFEVLWPTTPYPLARLCIFSVTGVAVTVSLLTHPRRRRHA